MSKKPSQKATKNGTSPTGSSIGGKGAGSKKKGSSANDLSTPAKIVIVIFAVLMVVSLMLPTLSTAFSGNQQAEQENSQDSSSNSSSDTSSESGADSPDAASGDAGSATGVDAVDAKYQDATSQLESKLASDSTNLAALLNLGRNYMRWGVSVRAVSSTDGDTSHGNELLEKAIDYYQQYLSLKDSNAVRVDIALCKFYEDNSSEALSDLEALTQSSPTYAPAWANLGMVQEYSGSVDAAKASYQAAIDADPDDEYGAKSYASQRLTSLESSSTSTTPSASAPTSSGETGAKGLSDTLNSLSGTGL